MAGATVPMHRADIRGYRVDMFHVVDFAGLRPPDGANILPKHPECGPRALTRWYFDAGFKFPISPAVFTAGVHAG